MSSATTPTVVGAFSARNIVGDTTGTAVPASYIGQVLKQTRLFSVALTLTDGVYSNITASPLVLDAGVWNISGAVGFSTTVSATTNFIRAAITKTSATAPANDTWSAPTNGEVIAGKTWAVASPSSLIFLPTVELPANNVVTLSVSTTFYLIGLSNLVSGAGAPTAYGSITAVRIA